MQRGFVFKNYDLRSTIYDFPPWLQPAVSEFSARLFSTQPVKKQPQIYADLEAMLQKTITQFGNYPITNEPMTR